MMTAKEMRRITELNNTSILNRLQNNMIKCAKEGKSCYSFYTHKKFNEATVKALNNLGYHVTQLCSPPDYECIIEW